MLYAFLSENARIAFILNNYSPLSLLFSKQNVCAVHEFNQKSWGICANIFLGSRDGLGVLLLVFECRVQKNDTIGLMYKGAG